MVLDRLTRRWQPPLLRTILVVPFVFEIVGAVTLTAWLASRRSEQAVRDAIEELTTQVNDKIESHIDEYLRIPHWILKANGIALETGILDAQNFPSLEQHFFSQLGFYSAVNYLYLGKPNGDFIGVQRLDRGIVTKIRDETTNELREIYLLDDAGERIRQESAAPYDSRERPWY